MDWLTRLPVVGPAAERFFRTRVWHVYEHLDARHWGRLTAAVTVSGFLALFPMLAVAAAVGAAFLSPDRMRTLKEWTADQLPGLADRLDLQAFVDNAGTVGLIGGALLMVTGVRWVGTLREVLRVVWDLEEDPGNVVLLRVKDLGALIGLGLVGLLSVAGSAFGLAAVDWAAERAGLAGGVGTVLLRLCGYAAAVVIDFLLLWYVLQWLPRVVPPRRSLLAAGLMGAVGFELLKALLGGYLQGVAAKSVYGAVGVPVALLLWISLMTRLLLFCAAWTATASRPVVDLEASEGPAEAPADETADETEDASAEGSDEGSANGSEKAHEDSPEEAPEDGSGTESSREAGAGTVSPRPGGPGRPGGATAATRRAASSASGGAPRRRPGREAPGSRP